MYTHRRCPLIPHSFPPQHQHLLIVSSFRFALQIHSVFGSKCVQWQQASADMLTRECMHDVRYHAIFTDHRCATHTQNTVRSVCSQSAILYLPVYIQYQPHLFSQPTTPIFRMFLVGEAMKPTHATIAFANEVLPSPRPSQMVLVTLLFASTDRPAAKTTKTHFSHLHSCLRRPYMKTAFIQASATAAEKNERCTLCSQQAVADSSAWKHMSCTTVTITFALLRYVQGQKNYSCSMHGICLSFIGFEKMRTPTTANVLSYPDNAFSVHSEVRALLLLSFLQANFITIINRNWYLLHSETFSSISRNGEIWN